MRRLSGLPWRRAAGLLVGLAASAACQAVVQANVYPCVNLPQLSANRNDRLPDLQGETQRVSEWFNACTRRPEASERTLYTWGHKRKLERALRDERLRFQAYDSARQRTYNQLQSEKFLENLPAQRGQLIRQARGYASDARLYDLLQLAELIEIGAPDRDMLRRALTLAMYETWLPGFLELASVPPEDRMDRFLQSHRSANALWQHRADGEIDGLIQFTERQAGAGTRGFLSSSSVGWGLSFSTNPVEFVTHFYDELHMGMTCRLPANDPAILVDLRDAAALVALKEARVLIPDGTRGLPIINSTLFVRPQAAEDAAQGRIIIALVGTNRSAVYTDKGALDYRVACDATTLENFPCSDWEALLAHPKYAGDSGRGGPVRDYFRRMAVPEDAGEEAEAIFSGLEEQKSADCAAAS